MIVQQKGRVVGGPCLSAWAEVCVEKILIAFSRPGSDLLSRVLRRSTIGAGAFHGRVRNGNGCGRPAITTRSAKGNVIEKLAGIRLFSKLNTLFVLSSRCRILRMLRCRRRAKLLATNYRSVLVPCSGSEPGSQR